MIPGTPRSHSSTALPIVTLQKHAVRPTLTLPYEVLLALFRLVGGGIAIVRLYRAGELYGHRIAMPVSRLAHRQPHPAFADAIFLDVSLLFALEADADARVSASAS